MHAANLVSREPNVWEVRVGDHLVGEFCAPPERQHSVYIRPEGESETYVEVHELSHGYGHVVFSGVVSNSLLDTEETKETADTSEGDSVADVHEWYVKEADAIDAEDELERRLEAALVKND